MKLKLTFLVLGVFLLSCGTKVRNSSGKDNQVKYQQVAEKSLGAGIDCTKNNSETYVLCVNEGTGSSEQPRKMLSFMVIRTSDNKVMLEQKVDGGTVNWYSDNEIEVFTIPGIMGRDQTKDDYTLIYNVVSGESSPKKGVQAK
ncbi:MAG: hypothetical protein KDC58_02415 [Cyclobacteriaceae bacterium]|nr:hypothetical protein [Cyclobacteriaceae bacterium]